MCESIRTGQSASSSIFPFSLGYLSKEKSKSGMFPQHNKKSHSDESVMMIVNSSIPSSSSSTLQFSQLEDDDVTEKYLTNSSKKFKKSNQTINPSTTQNKNIESEYLTNNDSGDYGDEIVVTLLSSPAHNDNDTNDDLSDDGLSTLTGEHPNDVYLSVPYSSQDHSAHLTSPSSGDSMIYAELNADSEDAVDDSPFHGFDLNHYKSNKIKPRKISSSRKGQLPASVNLMEDPVRNLWVTSKGHKQQLKECGHSWTTGMWSKEETRVLKENINKYCSERGIKDPNRIIFKTSKEERKDFYPTISAGLNRPLFAVYRRVKRLYDHKNHKGRYSREELDKLKRLTQIHGRDWTTIAQIMGRSSDSVKDRVRLIKKDLVSGKWTESEEERLANAVYDVTHTKRGEVVTEGIPWSTVASIVGNRTEKQCRSKWLNYLNWKLNEGKEWTKDDDRLLVQKIVALNATTENEINWNEISEGWSSVRSPPWLRKKWSDLKKILHECGLTDVTFSDTVKLLEKLFSEDIVKIWDKPKQLVKFLMGVQNNRNALDGCRKKVQAIKKKPRRDPPSDITTSIVSQQDETSSAPLFIQSGSPDRIFTSDYLSIPGEEQRRSSQSTGVSDSMRPTLGSEDKSAFNLLSSNTDFVNDTDGDAAISFSQGTYHLTPTSSAGIFLIQSAEDSSDQDMTMSGDTNRMVNITLPPDVLKSLLKTDDPSTPATLSLNDATDHEYLAHNSIQDQSSNSVSRDVVVQSQNDQDDVSIYVT